MNQFDRDNIAAGVLLLSILNLYGYFSFGDGEDHETVSRNLMELIECQELEIEHSSFFALVQEFFEKECGLMIPTDKSSSECSEEIKEDAPGGSVGEKSEDPLEAGELLCGEDLQVNITVLQALKYEMCYAVPFFLMRVEYKEPKKYIARSLSRTGHSYR